MKQMRPSVLSLPTILFILIMVPGCFFESLPIGADADRTTDQLPKTVYCNTPGECRFASGQDQVCCGLSSHIDPYFQLDTPVNTSDPTRKLGICSKSCDQVDRGKALQLCDSQTPLSCRFGRCAGSNAHGIGVCAPEINCSGDKECPGDFYCRVKFSFQRPNFSSIGGAKCTRFPRPGDVCSMKQRRLDPLDAVNLLKSRTVHSKLIYSFCVTSLNDFSAQPGAGIDVGRVVVPCKDDSDCEYLNNIPSPEGTKLQYGCAWQSRAEIVSSEFGICQIVKQGAEPTASSAVKTISCDSNSDCERPYGMTCCVIDPTLKRCTDPMTCQGIGP